MSGDRFHIVATNDITATLIAKKYTLAAALILSTELMDTWDDIQVREYPDNVEPLKEETAEPSNFKVVAKLSRHGLI